MKQITENGDDFRKYYKIHWPLSILGLFFPQAPQNPSSSPLRTRVRKPLVHRSRRACSCLPPWGMDLRSHSNHFSTSHLFFLVIS